MLELQGQAALSVFRLSKLEQAIKPSFPGLRSLSARFVYFAELDAPLKENDRDRLEALLLSGDAVEGGPPRGAWNRLRSCLQGTADRR